MIRRFGILGGMGPHATQHFMQVLLDMVTKRLQPMCDQDFPDMTVLYECTTPDRTAAIKTDTAAAAERINRDLAHLLALGCKPVAVACITAHTLIEPEMFRRGVLDFRDCLIKAYAGLRDTPIAILATDGSLANNVFAPLENHFRLIYPREPTQSSIMEAIYGAGGLKTDPMGSAQSRQALIQAFGDLRTDGAAAFLAGCTELEMWMARECTQLELLLPMASLCGRMCEFLEESD